jgi:hypothetical protein
MRIAAVMLLEGFLPVAVLSQDGSATAGSPPLVFRRTRVETRPAETEASLEPFSAPGGRAHDGLEEQPGGTPAGGIIVDLRGRLGSLLILEAGADGTLHARCVEHPPLTLLP